MTEIAWVTVWGQIQLCCYGLNCVPPPPPPHPQTHTLTFWTLMCGIWRWSLWEVIRFRWGHEGRDSCFFFSLSGHREMAVICNPEKNLSPETKSSSTLILGSQTPELRNKCWLSHIVYDILLKQPKLTKTFRSKADLSLLLWILFIALKDSHCQSESIIRRTRPGILH